MTGSVVASAWHVGYVTRSTSDDPAAVTVSCTRRLARATGTAQPVTQRHPDFHGMRFDRHDTMEGNMIEAMEHVTRWVNT